MCIGTVGPVECGWLRIAGACAMGCLERPLNLIPTMVMTLGLGACVSLSGDGGMAPVQGIAYAELKADAVKVSTESENAAAAERVAALLKRPLTPGTVVQIALLNNRGLQASYNELGISEAQYVQASLPPSPRFGFNQLVGDLEVEITRQLVGNVLALATLPARSEIAQARFRAAQLRAAEATLTLATETREQFYRAVAANEQVNLTMQTHGSVGDSEPTEARMKLRIERERLARLLGLWDDVDYKLPPHLPTMPSRIRSIREAEEQALRNRLDLQIAKVELDALAKTLGLTQATRFISAFDLAAQNRYKSTRKVSADSASKTTTITDGFVATIEIPLFDFGQARVAEAEQRYLQAANKLAEIAVNARSEAREAYHAYRGTYELARVHQKRNAPTGRLAGIQAAAQAIDQAAAPPEPAPDMQEWMSRNIKAIEARRDFWIADTELIASGSGARTNGGLSSLGGPRI
jgi:outer membrane protein TolC